MSRADFTWIQCFFTFETDIARGRGFFRLMRDSDDGAWKAKSVSQNWRYWEDTSTNCPQDYIYWNRGMEEL